MLKCLLFQVRPKVFAPAWRRMAFVVIFIVISLSCHSQKADSIKRVTHFSGSVNVTNNGISLVPNFSLGKPAVIVNLSAGNGRLSFDPDIRFSLSAKPWTMLFWLRYKAVNSGRFRLRTGAHLGLNYKISSVPIGGDNVEANIVRRYLAAEVVPQYLINEKIRAGLYYLYSYGLDAGTVGNTHFLVFNTSFSDIKISKQLVARFTPQVYYLKQDARQGTYFTSSLNIGKKDFPLSIEGFINQRLGGNILGSKNFTWSASLIYTFNKRFIPGPHEL